MRNRLAFLLLSLLFAAPVMAAPAAGAAPSPRLSLDDSDAGQREGAAPTEETASDADEASAEGEDDSPAEDSPAEEGSPFDYQASEQISEDLSVSFPVDI